MDVIVPVKQVTVSALAPRYFEQCILFNPTPPLADNVDPIIDTGISTPVAPGITYESIPVITEIIDTSPSQLIGCVNDTTPEVQYRLNHEFPDAIEEDGVVDRSTNDIWVLRDGAWVNVGPTPGPTIVVQSTVAVWNEIIPVVSRTRTTISVQSLNYALASETTVDPIITKTEISVTSAIATILNPPAINISIAGQTPTISTGYRALAPAGDISLAPAVPSVSTGTSVTVPETIVSIAGVAPEQVGVEITQVTVPLANLTLAAFAPVVVGGASVAVPAKDITLAGVAPKAGYFDADFSSVSLLLHMEGSNASTTFTDSSSNALSVTANGNAQISTAQSKFGSASGLFDGTGDYLSVNNSAVALSQSAHTIEGWVRLTSLPATKWGFAYNGDPTSNNNRIQVEINPTGTLSVFFQAGAGTGGGFGTTATLSTGTWHHIAYTKSGSSAKLFIDGVESASGTYTSSITTNNNFYVGWTRSGGVNYSINGYIDDFRVTKGVARYTGTFTPPAQAFADQ